MGPQGATLFLYEMSIVVRIDFIAILLTPGIFSINIIKKGRQCKAEREWYTPYQSQDPSPTIPTNRQKEEKGKKSRRL